MSLEEQFKAPTAQTFWRSLSGEECSELRKSIAFVRTVLLSREEAQQHYINLLGIGNRITEPGLHIPKYDRDPARAAMEDEHTRGVLLGLELALDLVANLDTLGQVEDHILHKE